MQDKTTAETTATTTAPIELVRPPSALALYKNEKEASLRAEHPDLGKNALAKKMALSWNHLPPYFRQPYMDKAELLHQDYLNKLKDGNFIAAKPPSKKRKRSQEDVNDAEEKRRKKLKMKQDEIQQEIAIIENSLRGSIRELVSECKKQHTTVAQVKKEVLEAKERKVQGERELVKAQHQAKKERKKQKKLKVAE